jgi:F0F1-type ATP synthase assembly protein I
MILRALRAGALAAAGFMVLVIGIEVWKRWRFGGLAAMAGQDAVFFAVLLLMLVAFLWLARAIARELASHGS